MDTRDEKFSSKMTASERAAQRKRIREREEAERKKRKEAKHKAALEKRAQGELKGSADSSKASDSQNPNPSKNDSSKNGSSSENQMSAGGGGELSGASPVVPPDPPALTPAVVLDQNAKTVCAQLPTITDVQLLKDILSAEEADKKRATVLSALRYHIQQLEGRG